MNVVKVYLKEVHEEKSYTTEWFKQFSDKEFVKVTATWISFGEEYKKTIVLFDIFCKTYFVLMLDFHKLFLCLWILCQKNQSGNL